ncbi:hypothetical protein K469DRAFT_237497 [Zopfia rhizophila CBS 207.26]|uniref:Cora-domain-containing protein n=1 Tax=Zopfia rhizophila CBS 207.26 TaxID=1314779 RepID=A0A6A6ETU2_9PEZI|nr:hypothetical protein K469DRAFT_237497 [Zopfia rhizophila CBS 207.26]
MFPNPLFSLYEREHFNDLKYNVIDGESSTYAISINIVAGKATVSKSCLRGEHTITQWLLEAQMENSRSQGGLRLRLAANPKKKHFQKAAIQQNFHNNDKFFLGKYHPPLSASDQERIVSAFGLPAPAAWALSAEFSHFQRYSQSASNRIGFSMRQASQGGLNMDLGLGLSFDHERNLTYGMLLGCIDRQAAFIITQLKELALLACHPLLLPTMILGYERSFLGEQLLRTRSEMLSVEATSGQTRWPVVGYAGQPGQSELKPDKVNTKELSKDALGVVQSATVYQRLTEDLLVLADSLVESNEVLRQFVQRDGCAFATIYAIDERLRFLRNKTELMLPALRSYKERAHAQMSAVYNLIAERNNEINQQLNIDTQEIAAASRKDSSAMKSVAVLTMAFLPGTFVATMFALPFFDFSAGQGQQMVLPRFWIYWAVTIPLTGTVMLLWLISLTYSSTKHDTGTEKHNILTRIIRVGYEKYRILKRQIRRTEPFDVEKAE